MRSLRAFRIVLLSVWASACSGPGEVTKALPDAPALTLSEEWRLDGSTELLGPIGWVVVGPSDEVFVGHHLDARIIAFDSAGRRRAIFGGRGREPGSFENLMRAGTLADTLWVYDGLLRRVTMFGTDLRVVRHFRWPPPYSVQSLEDSRDATVPYLLGITPEGAIVSSVYRERLSRLAADSLGLPYDRGGLFVPEGRRLMTAHAVPSNATYGGGVLIDNIRLFPVDPVFAASSDGTAFVYVEPVLEGPEAGTLRITRFDHTGDTTFVRQHPFYPVRIPAEVVEQAVEQGVRRLRESPRGSREAIDAYRRAAHAPPMYPPVLGALPGRDGTTWLRMRPLVEDNSEYLVLDQEGDLVGQLSVPGNFEIVAAEMSRVWTIATDSLGTQSVVRYSVDGWRTATDPEQ